MTIAGGGGGERQMGGEKERSKLPSFFHYHKS